MEAWLILMHPENGWKGDPYATQNGEVYNGKIMTYSSRFKHPHQLVRGDGQPMFSPICVGTTTVVPSPTSTLAGLLFGQDLRFWTWEIVVVGGRW